MDEYAHQGALRQPRPAAAARTRHDAVSPDPRQAEQLLRLQRDVAVCLQAKRELRDAMESLLELTCRIPGVECGGVYRVDDVRGRAGLIAHRNLSATFVQAVDAVNTKAPGFARIQARRPIYHTVSAAPASPLRDLYTAEGLRSVAGIPIQYGDEIIATLNMASRSRVDRVRCGRSARCRNSVLTLRRCGRGRSAPAARRSRRAGAPATRRPQRAPSLPWRAL